MFDDHRRHFGNRILFDVNPAYAWIATEPSLLAHGKLSGAGDDQFHGCILADTAIEILQSFLVAQRLTCRLR